MHRLDRHETDMTFFSLLIFAAKSLSYLVPAVGFEPTTP
jgi:hypothetical protein